MKYGPDERMVDLGALLAATNPDALHRALVLAPPALQEREPFIATCLFRSAHEREPAGAVMTAMLLMTDSRWSVTARPLARAIESAGIVPDDELDLLARTFIAADKSVYWACPSNWFDGPAILITIGDESADDTDDIDKADQDDDASDVVVARAIPDGLRRWAASRRLRSDPTAWSSLYQLARATGGPRGGAIMLGILDERSSLPELAVNILEIAGSGWSRKDVRAAARRRPIQIAAGHAGESEVASETTFTDDRVEHDTEGALF